MTNAFTLVLAILTVESSYVQEIERPATRVPDTVQFWFAPESDWRIKTFAIDHDIHAYRIGKTNNGARRTLGWVRNHDWHL